MANDQLQFCVDFLSFDFSHNSAQEISLLVSSCMSEAEHVINLLWLATKS